MHQQRVLTTVDLVLVEIDQMLRAVLPPLHRQSRHLSPAHGLVDPVLSDNQRRHVAGLMRVNHAGEVCAQALYRGQALTASLDSVKTTMAQAADEELDHLAWCEQRLHELGSQPTVFNLLWYSGSWLIGVVAGIVGDRWSLGFVVETEHQVGVHLTEHLQNLPAEDIKTQAILTKMHQDEMHHAEVARAAGAAELPMSIKYAMSCVSKLLTRGSYYF